MQIAAKDLFKGAKIKSGSMVFEVVSIDSVTDKAITYTTTRISPDRYGAFFNRKLLATKIELV